MRKQLLSIVAITVLFTTAHAQTVALDTIEVTAANRTTQNIKDITESVTVITSEDIKESKVNTLSEALNRFGNIAMTNNGGVGKSTSMLIRGMDTQRTLVLIDGIRYNDITGGAPFQHFQLNDVERIEIIKGAQSGVWGADASAGVINIVTKNAQTGTHATFNVEGGSFNTQQGSLQLSHKEDTFDVVAGVARYKTDGFSAAEPKHGAPDYGKRGDELGWEDDAYTNNTYNVKLGLNVTDNDRFEASYRRIDAYVEYDAGAGADAENYPVNPWTNTPYYEKSDNRFYSAAFKHEDDLNDLALQYNYSSLSRKVADFKGNVEEVSLQDRIDYMEDSFIKAGGSYQRFEHESAGDSINKNYNAKSVFATNYNKFDAFEALGESIFTQSLRYDRYSTFENKTTGKIGLKQFVYDDIYFSANYGTAYNTPTLYQLYAPPSFGFSFNNPDLNPEETKAFDITVGNDQLTLTYFYNKVKDMIDYSFTAYRFENIEGTSKIKGMEIGYQDDLFDVISLGLNYTYLDAKNSDGEALARRPKHQVDGNIFYYITEQLNVGLNGQYIGTRYDKANNQGAQTGKYTIWNMVINYQINNNFTVYGKIDNLGDKYYKVVDGYATAERSYYVGLTAEF